MLMQTPVTPGRNLHGRRWALGLALAVGLVCGVFLTTARDLRRLGPGHDWVWMAAVLAFLAGLAEPWLLPWAKWNAWVEARRGRLYLGAALALVVCALPPLLAAAGNPSGFYLRWAFVQCFWLLLGGHFAATVWRMRRE